MRLRNHVAIAAENFGNEENLSPVLIPTLSEDMDDQLELAHKLVDEVDRANRNFCDSVAVEHGQGREFICSSPKFGRNKEDEKFQQFAYKN